MSNEMFIPSTKQTNEQINQNNNPSNNRTNYYLFSFHCNNLRKLKVNKTVSQIMKLLDIIL